MRDEGVIYVAGHPLLNRRRTRLPGCILLRKDLHCVGWGVELLTQNSELSHSRCRINLHTLSSYELIAILNGEPSMV